MIYQTDTQRAHVSPFGWGRLPSGVWVSATPYVDTNMPGTFAHLSRNRAIEVGERDGVRLIRPETLRELNTHGFWVAPQILPDASQRAANPRAPGETADAYERRIRKNMSSADWCNRHDFAVWAELADSDWDLATPIMGAGKPWISGARETIAGWPKHPHDPNTSNWWQPPQAAHLDGTHVDYSSLQTYESDSCPTASFPGWEFDRVLDSIGDPVDHALSYLGVTEATGRNDGEQIARFFSGATRRGKDGQERPTGWRSGWEWCAAFFGHCDPGVPHRIAVHEYVKDARARGDFRTVSEGYEPRRNDAIIYARDGQDPRDGGAGHIARYIRRLSGAPGTRIGCYESVGGNEQNRVLQAPKRFNDPTIVGWIRWGDA